MAPRGRDLLLVLLPGPGVALLHAVDEEAPAEAVVLGDHPVGHPRQAEEQGGGDPGAVLGRRRS